MRLGKVQRDIVDYLKECKPEVGGILSSCTRARQLRGYDLVQVERAVAGLVKRGIVRKESIRYVLVQSAAPEEKTG